MENLAKPSLGFLRETIVKKFLLAMVTICGPERGRPRDPLEPRSGVRPCVLAPCRG
jgi:hypothetical protein